MHSVNVIESKKDDGFMKLCETQYNLQCQSRIASLDLGYESEYDLVTVPCVTIVR